MPGLVRLYQTQHRDVSGNRSSRGFALNQSVLMEDLLDLNEGSRPS